MNDNPLHAYTFSAAKLANPQAFAESCLNGTYASHKTRRESEPAWLYCDADEFLEWLEERKTEHE